MDQHRKMTEKEIQKRIKREIKFKEFKYTRKMPRKLNAVYNAALFAIFIPMMLILRSEDTAGLPILITLFVILFLAGTLYRIFGYCQLTDQGLLVMPTKQLIQYPTIIGLIEIGSGDLEVEYFVGDKRYAKMLAFTARGHFVMQLHAKMKR